MCITQTSCVQDKCLILLRGKANPGLYLRSVCFKALCVMALMAFLIYSDVCTSHRSNVSGYIGWIGSSPTTFKSCRGRGSFWTIYKGVVVVGHTDVAVKVIDPPFLINNTSCNVINGKSILTLLIFKGQCNFFKNTPTFHNQCEEYSLRSTQLQKQVHQ